MKIRLLILLLFAFGISSCSKENKLNEKFSGQWTLVEYANILGQVHCRFDEGAITWNFEDGKLKIYGRLISPRGYKPCYIIDNIYNEELNYVMKESDSGDIIYIEDLDLMAKISFDEELIIEIISTSTFRPSTEGVKVFFKKI